MTNAVIQSHANYTKIQSVHMVNVVKNVRYVLLDMFVVKRQMNVISPKVKSIVFVSLSIVDNDKKKINLSVVIVCNGDSGQCPNDVYKKNGSPCGATTGKESTGKYFLLLISTLFCCSLFSLQYNKIVFD